MSENKPSPFKVSIKLVQGNNALLAKADVAGAKMTINGFSVLSGKDGKGPWVAPPQMKVGSGYVKIVEITDKATNDVISKLVLEAYGKALSERPETDNEAAF